jgi:hypothetical protein
MIRLLAMALWASLCAVLASTAATQWQASRAAPAALGAGKSARTYEFKKTRVINVPVISDGALEGYVIVQFLYAIDARAAETLTVSPDAFLMDQAFRTLYGDPKLDFRHLEKYDMATLTGDLKTLLNARLGEGMVSEVLIQDFSYMTKEQAPR